MRPISSFPLCVLASAVLCSMAGMAQQVAPTVQIVNRIDERNLVTLKGNTLPVANAKNDRGRVSPDLPMNDLVLVLSRSAQQQAAFDKFVASQYEAGSANYHHWLEPEEVGAKFGPAQSDIDAVSSWLASHGFSVGELSKDRLTIRFSGTASQVESAFHTEIHNVEVKGVQHIANMRDLQIPAALAPAVVGIKSLHNLFPKPMHRLGSQVELNRATGKWQRIASPTSEATKAQAATRKARTLFGTTDSNNPPDVIEDVTPYDFATIYNVQKAWTNGYTGKNQTIAIAGTSRLEGTADNPTDVVKFRSTFGLPAIPSFNTILGNSYDPSICTSTSSTALCGIGDLTENSLDVEWSGAVATGADIVLVVSGYNDAKNPTNDPVYDSASYIVNNKTGNILNVSYGLCELIEGTAGNVSYYNLWQSAATEGISVFVSTGDSGSASCDEGGDASGTPYAAEYGLSVSGLASTPYNTAVGGTDFNWCPANSTTACTAAPYWGKSNDSHLANAVGYVPEIPWNDSCVSPTGIAVAQYWTSQINGAGLGFTLSNPTTAEASCNFFVNYSQLIYDNTTPPLNLSGLVDTVGGSGGQSGCVSNDTTSTTADVTSCGTPKTVTVTNPDKSTSTITLVNGGWPKPSWQTNASIPGLPTDGVRDIPDVSFFAADGENGSAYLICVSADNNPCTYTGTSDNTPLDAQEVGGTSVASPAMAGVMALINQKAGSAQGLANPILYSLAAKQPYSSCSAQTVTASSSCYFNDIAQYTTNTIGVFTNSQPCDWGDFGYESPNCSVISAGDGVGILANSTTSLGGYTAVTGYDMATGLGSLNVYNVVNGWTSTTTTPSFALSNGGNITVAAGATTGDTSTISVTPSDGFTGSVALTCAVTTAPSGATSPATCSLASPSVASGSGTDVLTVSTTATTTTGAYVVTVTGTSGSLTETTTVNVTVTTAVSTGSFTLSATDITLSAGATTGNTSTVTVTGTGGYTGTVTLTAAVTSSPTGAVSTPTFTGSVVTIPSGATTGTGTITVGTTAEAASAVRAGHSNRSGWFEAAGGAMIASLLFFFLPVPTRRWGKVLSAMLLLAAVSFAGVGCGGSTPTKTTPITPTVSVKPAKTSIAVTDTLSVSISVTGSGSTAPTGTVTLTSGTYNSGATALASGAATITIPANSLAAGATDTLTVAYSGDSNYNSASGTATVAVSKAGTTSGTYTVTVTGTDMANTKAITTFTLTVN